MSSQGRLGFFFRLGGGSLNKATEVEPDAFHWAQGDASPPTSHTGGDLTFGNDKFYLEKKGVRRVVKFIGKGTFSKVYECDMPRLGGPVAVKIIQRPSETDSRHLEFASKLEHPHLVKLIRVLDTDPLCAVYKLCKGGSFFAVLREKSEVGLLPRIKAMHQVFTALEYLHGIDIIHRDVKPENVFLTETAQGHDTLPPVVLGDLGFARVVPLGDSAAMTSCGTVRYMAPEVLAGDPYGKSADVYSCGMSLFETIMGDVPDTRRALRFREVKLGMQTMKGVRPCLDGVAQKGPAGAALAEVIAAAWAHDAHARMSAAALAKSVGECIDQLCGEQGAEA